MRCVRLPICCIRYSGTLRDDTGENVPPFLCDSYFDFVKYEFILAGIAVWTGAGFM